MLRIVGSCEERLFGITPAERLTRQTVSSGELHIVAHASAVLSDVAVDWLKENPGSLLTTPSGVPAAVACMPAELQLAEEWIAGGAAPAMVNPAQMAPMFIRKLRRRDTLFVRRLDESSRADTERLLFDTVYKGVTDVVTKYVWPMPALWATRLCASVGVGPNLVTVLGMALVIIVALLWAEGWLAAGLILAWAMTFLDTLDGKLARVTVTSSPIGNILDHATDIIHPPIWWVCLALGLAKADPGLSGPIWLACWTILGGYVAGRALEEWFKHRIGYNAYLWRPFDSAFRLIVSRRNVILLIMTAGLLADIATVAFLVAAAWTILSVAVQIVRFVQAIAASRHGGSETWLK